MRRLILAVLLVQTATAPAAASSRVASIGLCADQSLVALLEEDRIAALSPQARDPNLSVVAEQAANLPVIAPSAEAVLMTGADVVAANYYGELKTVAMLERLGVRVIRVPSAETFEEMSKAILTLGDDLNVPERARALADDIAARRQALRQELPSNPPLAVYYRPDGGSAGAGTFVSGAMAAAGLDSLSTHLGRTGWGRLDLEPLIMNRPEAFVTSFFGKGAYSARQAFGRHPLLRRMMADIPVIEVPGRLWSCGGWPLIEAAELMSRARQDKDIR